VSIAVGILAADCPSSQAKPNFNSSEIEGRCSEIIFCDLDGDHLSDASG